MGSIAFLSNFTIAPIFEISSGRPFNILSNQDTNNDQSNQTDRPSVLADGTLCVPGTAGLRAFDHERRVYERKPGTQLWV